MEFEGILRDALAVLGSSATHEQITQWMADDIVNKRNLSKYVDAVEKDEIREIPLKKRKGKMTNIRRTKNSMD